MRPMEQVLVLSTKPWHLTIGMLVFLLAAYGLVLLEPGAFKMIVSIYIAWRVARWTLLTKPEQNDAQAKG